jgi:hypothetical protein
MAERTLEVLSRQAATHKLANGSGRDVGWRAGVSVATCGCTDGGVPHSLTTAAKKTKALPALKRRSLHVSRTPMAVVMGDGAANVADGILMHPCCWLQSGDGTNAAEVEPVSLQQLVATCGCDTAARVDDKDGDSDADAAAALATATPMLPQHW